MTDITAWTTLHCLQFRTKIPGLFASDYYRVIGQHLNLIVFQTRFRTAWVHGGLVCQLHTHSINPQTFKG
jgi:hypothetical protein